LPQPTSPSFVVQRISFTKEKRLSTVDDLLERFTELRKAEKLTSEMLKELRCGYL
jgi:hypothetical protein